MPTTHESVKSRFGNPKNNQSSIKYVKVVLAKTVANFLDYDGDSYPNRSTDHRTHFDRHDARIADSCFISAIIWCARFLSYGGRAGRVAKLAVFDPGRASTHHRAENLKLFIAAPPVWRS